MSTLNEIAANHARMAKILAGEPIEAGVRAPQVVGGFEVLTVGEPPRMPLHLIAVAQDSAVGHIAL